MLNCLDWSDVMNAAPKDEMRNGLWHHQRELHGLDVNFGLFDWISVMIATQKMK